MARKVISNQWLFVLLITGCVSAVLALVCEKGMTGPACTNYDYAYNKQATQKNWLFSSEAVRYPKYAVNDVPDQCSATDKIWEPWWRVDLGNYFHIDGVMITPPFEDLDKFKIFTVQVSNSADGVRGMCYDQHAVAPVTTTIHTQCRQDLLARYVWVTIYYDGPTTTTSTTTTTTTTTAAPNSTTTTPTPDNTTVPIDPALISLQLCNVGVYGACNEGFFGNYCETPCGDCLNGTQHPCRKTDGYCPLTGRCEPGFVSPYCIEKCPFGTYGTACSSYCGECRDNATCNVYNGRCPSLGDCHEQGGCPLLDPCEPGYQEPLCQLECDPHYYGYGCQPCGNCKNSDDCERTNGTCPNGCQSGYINNLNNPLCTIPCDDGTYGDSCMGYCGKCWNWPCNKFTGHCEGTCAPGYKTTQDCHTPCELGTYGHNCQGTCGECGRVLDDGSVVKVTCSTSNGACPTGCLMGFQGAGCKERCVKGTWALNCDKACLHCSDCDLISGVCVKGTCTPGWKGDKCDQECPAGTFGNYCGHQCPANCKDTYSCDTADGSCICKDGWTGVLCTEVCQANHWGDGCSQQCGHCADCRQSDGICKTACTEGWHGPKCTMIVAPSEYEPDHGAIIGGVIGGFFALVLIAILVAYIVWSWRTGTPMNPQEFVRAARRSLRASQKFARSSIDRLSMRRRRQLQDRQKLAKHGVMQHQNGGIEVIDTAGDLSERIYDCVGLPSNTIHADDFQRIYLQLQEVEGQGRTELYTAFQRFQSLLTDTDDGQTNGSDNKAYYNGGNDVHLESSNDGPKFLPLGSNLSGFLLVQSSASSETTWQHVQTRQIETVITIGKVASVTWKPRERVTIGKDTIECVDVQLLSSHTESKLTIRKMNAEARRAIRHYEVTLWDGGRVPNVSTLLMFIDRFQQISAAQRGRSILVNYVSLRDEAVTFAIIASALALLAEDGRVDFLRAVNMAGKMAAKSMRKFESFKYLHDVFFQYIAMEVGKRERPAESKQVAKRGPPPLTMDTGDRGPPPDKSPFNSRGPPGHDMSPRQHAPPTDALQFINRANTADINHNRHRVPSAESSHATPRGPPMDTKYDRNREAAAAGPAHTAPRGQNLDTTHDRNRGPELTLMAPRGQHLDATHDRNRGQPAEPTLTAPRGQHIDATYDRNRGSPAEPPHVTPRRPPRESRQDRNHVPLTEPTHPAPQRPVRDTTETRPRGPPADSTHMAHRGPPADNMQTRPRGPPTEYTHTTQPRGPSADNLQTRPRGPPTEYTHTTQPRGPSADNLQTRPRGPSADSLPSTVTQRGPPLDTNPARQRRGPPVDTSQITRQGPPPETVELEPGLPPEPMQDTMI